MTATGTESDLEQGIDEKWIGEDYVVVHVVSSELQVRERRVEIEDSCSLSSSPW